MKNIMVLAAGLVLALGAEATTIVQITQAAPDAPALVGETMVSYDCFIVKGGTLNKALGQKGEYAAAAAFFKAALSGKGAAAPQPVVMNDYADTLRHLGRYAEAEDFARRAVALSGGKVPLFRQTLDQILDEAKAHKGNAKEKKT